ncbi:MAG: hypothetical protein ACKN9D_11230, partial [Actinomycetales bacterium]
MRKGFGFGFGGILVGSLIGALLVAPQSVSAVPEAVRQAPQSPQAAPHSTPMSVSAAKAKPRVTMTGGPRLLVQVGPAQAGPGAWRFTLERRNGNSWERAGDYLTRGTREEVSLPVGAGTYRVVVPAQHDYPETTSTPRQYVPTPNITVGGYATLEVKIGPIRDWRVTLERQTDTGWSTVKATKTRGIRPMSFEVDAGTYRVRTQANGRFPELTGKPFAFQPQAPAGLIPFEMIDAAFSTAPTAAKQTRAATPRAASSNCSSVMSPSSDIGLKVATGVINYIPYVGGALSSGIQNRAGNAQANAQQACVSAQFATMNAQLAYQEAQIDQIQLELSQAKGAILQAFYAVDGEITNANLTAFMEDVNNLAQCSGGGLLYDFMTDFGLWDSCDAPTSATVEEVAQSPLFASQYTFAGVSAQQLFNEYIQGVSGSQVSNKCSGSLLPNPPGKEGVDCYKYVRPVGLQSSQALAEALVDQLVTATQVNVNDGVNAVPLFDQYNNALVGYYEQSVIALQAGFTLETLVNQLNYYNAGEDLEGCPAGGCFINSLGQVPGTYYSIQKLQATLGREPSATEQAEYYNLAQQALAQLYAARMNQLYINTISFIVTDAPAGGQVWPTGSGSNSINEGINYALNVGNSVTRSTTAKGSSPLCMLPAKSDMCPPTGEPSNAALYQYIGLRDAGKCYANILQWNKNNGTAVQAANGKSYPTAFPSPSELSGGAYNTQCPPILTTKALGAVSAPPTSSSFSSCATYAVVPGTQGGSGSSGS